MLLWKVILSVVMLSDFYQLIFCTEAFWVDITLHNPLETEVTLANPTVIVESSSGDAAWIRDNITIETTNDTILYAKESRTVSGNSRVFLLRLTVIQFRSPSPLRLPNQHHWLSQVSPMTSWVFFQLWNR